MNAEVQSRVKGTPPPTAFLRYEYSRSADVHPCLASQQWCQTLLSAPRLEFIFDIPSRPKGCDYSNSMLEVTLRHEEGIKARQLFRRPCGERDSATGSEDGYLFTMGTALDGRRTRAHGGFSSLLLDYLSGTCVHRYYGTEEPPATATLTVDYKAALVTPGTYLARSWITSINGRKYWTKSVIEDAQGKVYVVAKALFIEPRATKL